MILPFLLQLSTISTPNSFVYRDEKSPKRLSSITKSKP